MSENKKAEEFFWKMIHCKKSLVQIPQDCSQGENGVLVYLAFSENKSTPSELSEKLKVSLPRIVSVINSLEAKKLVTKEIDSIDKRKTIIAITEEGKQIVESRKNEAIEKVAKVLARLDENETDEYIRLTEKIIKIIDEI